jgi:uncharacterized protein GlcG (DUF336 family)
MTSISTSADVTTEQAEAILQAGVREARGEGLLMNVAVVDVGGNLKAFTRMDGAWLGSIDIAIKKARTARLFDMESGDLEPMVQPGKSLYHIEFSNGGLIPFPGGIPLTTGDGQVVGAVGASGSTPDADRRVAQAGVSAFA